MKTYQDLLELNGEESKVKDFILQAIANYQSTEEYRLAKIAEEYDKQRNVTITRYEKFLYTVTGNVVRDTISANHKLPSNYYNKFNVQENQYLLGNGVTFNDKSTKDRLGTGKYAFDTQLQKLGKKALTHRKAYGFFDLSLIHI